MTVLEQLAERIVSQRERPLSPAVRQRLAIHVLDTVGAWIAGRASDEGAKLSSLESASRLKVTLLGNASLDRIALGVATVRLTEIDDIHMASCTTPSSVVVPTCLTMIASAEKPDTDSFAQALYAGYEIVTRFGAAVDGPEIVYRGIWPTFLAAPLVAAAVTARILGLDAAKTANAFAIALSLTSGALGTPNGQSARWLLLGLAARNGCAAALMADEGYIGDHTLLDGDWLLRTHGISCDAATLLRDRPDGDAINSISLKPYCCAKQCVAAIQAFRNVLDQGVAIEEIATVRVRVPRAYAAMIGHRQAADGRIRRLTSAAYNLAVAAYRPTELSGVSRFDQTTDPRIAAFMNCIEVQADDELARHFPQRWPARVDVTLKDGKLISSTVLDTAGDPAKPFDAAEALAKFRHLTAAPLAGSTTFNLAQACLVSIEQLDALKNLRSWLSER
jgi:2-methylcitrate dehydratase PrpD